MNNKVITSYKAFDKNMQCRGFQYEVGKEYEMDGEIKCCNRGFHACKSPLEVWDYYDMLNSRYAEVEQSGKIDAEENIDINCIGGFNSDKIMKRFTFDDGAVFGILEEE